MKRENMTLMHQLFIHRNYAQMKLHKINKKKKNKLYYQILNKIKTTLKSLKSS